MLRSCLEAGPEKALFCILLTGQKKLLRASLLGHHGKAADADMSVIIEKLGTITSRYGLLKVTSGAG